MKRTHTTYISLFIAGIFLSSCEPNIEGPSFTNGNADFSKFITIGNSFTAGYTNSELYLSGQQHSFPAILAEQMNEVDRRVFKQPYMVDELGFGRRLKLDYVEDCREETSLSPTSYGGQPSANNTINISSEGPFNNIGVPGMKITELTLANYEQFNPYYARFKSPDAATVLDHVDLIDPTFFTAWIGNNDVLLDAMNGSSAGTFVTPVGPFESAYRAILEKLTGNGAQGIIANIPDITSIPHFNTIPYNSLTVNQSEANQLNLLYANNANINFEPGNNPFVIQDGVTIRQMEEGELLVLTLPLDEVKCNNYGSIVPFRDEHVLTENEIVTLQATIGAYNIAITTLTKEFNVGLFDANLFLAKVNSGITFDGVDLNTTYVSGGMFSLDGIHFTDIGNAVLANEFIQVINKKYGANLPKVNTVGYNGVVFP